VKSANCAKWLANPNYARSQFPQKFWSSYEYFSHCQIEDSLSCLKTLQAPILTIEPKSVADSEPVAQSSLNTYLFVGLSHIHT
jgi:hypothetical protein